MPRNGKQKERLTKREIRRLRRIIAYNTGVGCDEPEDCEEISYPSYCEYEGGALPTQLHVSLHTNTHHVRVFSHFYPNIKYIDLGNRQLAFMKVEDRDAYDSWYTGYISKFASAEKMNMPPPIDRHYPHIEPASFPTKSSKGSYVVSISGSSPKSSASNSSTNSEFDNWLWILENCQDEVRYGGNHFYFESKDDAALYHLARS